MAFPTATRTTSWALGVGAWLSTTVAWGQPTPPAQPSAESPPASSAEPQPEAWSLPGNEAPPAAATADPAASACASRDECRRFGLCTAHEGQCYAASNEECRRSEGCLEGRCTADQGRCVIASSEDCQRSPGCRDSGRCSLRAGVCVVASDADCSQTTACRVYRACTARQGRCVFGHPAAVLLAPEPEAATKPRSLLVYRVGVGFTIAGVALAVGGAAMMASDDARVWAAAVLAPTSGALVVSGIPLWALGGSKIPAATEPRSDAATIGGTVIAGLGLGGATVSGVFAVAGTRVALLPLGLSLGALGGGVGLATYGAEEVPLGTAGTMPHVQIGPGSLDLRWSF